MKTYIICTSPPGKSISNYFFLLADKICREGNKVIVITDQNQPELLPETKENQIFLSWPSRRPTKLRDFIFFYRVCKQYKPDVALAQFSSTNVVLFISKLLNVPHTCNYWHTMFEQINIDRKKSKVVAYILKTRKKLLLKYCAHHIFTNSQGNKDDLVSHYQIAENKVQVFNYLIPDYFRNKKIAGREQRAPLITFVARLDKSKGHAYVIEDMPHLLALFPDLKLYVIGDGRERKNLEALVRQLNMEEHVFFVGEVPLAKVYEYISISLLHVSASEQEAFGLVNAEALSAGTPILANKVGGITEILEDKKNGLFFNPRQKGDFTNKATELLNGDWNAYSQYARASFIKKFSDAPANVQAHFERLQELVAAG